MTISKAFHVENEAGLQNVAAYLAALHPKSGLITLDGDLGAGKTALARALIRTLTQNPEQDVPSPTYTLLQTYDTPNTEIWHFDLYRLKDADEIYELGWEDALSPDNLILIEWPSRITPLLPSKHTHVNITITSPTTREVVITHE